MGTRADIFRLRHFEWPVIESGMDLVSINLSAHIVHRLRSQTAHALSTPNRTDLNGGNYFADGKEIYGNPKIVMEGRSKDSREHRKRMEQLTNRLVTT